MPTEREFEDARLSVELWKKRDPTAFVKANNFQQRLFRAILNPKPESLTVVLALKPNRVGGSFGLMNIWSALMWGSENTPHFQGSPFGKNWPFLKSARLFSTAENLADVGALQLAMRQVFPPGRYEQSRGIGKGYNSAGKTDNGWTWDAFSFGQDALAAAGANKGLIMGSEPPPRPLFTECITRLSGNGLLILECVQLDLAPWLDEMAEDAGGQIIDGIQYGTLKLDGKAVGEIRVVRGDVEDACREHSNGHMAHSAIEAMVASWPPEEREARKTGKSLHLSGRIFPNWSALNEIESLPEYHQDCWDRDRVVLTNVIDPADRKPWAIAWFATFPNNDVIEFAEWPPFDYAACKSSPISNIESYRDILLEAEASIGKPIRNRVIDGLFGAAIKSGRGLNVIQMLSAPCEPCLEKHGKEKAWAGACRHRLTYRQAPAYDGSVRDGHILVRTAIGENGARAKDYTMTSCPNAIFGQRRYAYKENLREDKGLSGQPQLVHKDFPDLKRMLYLCGLHKYPSEPKPTIIIPRRKV